MDVPSPSWAIKWKILHLMLFPLNCFIIEVPFFSLT